MIWNAKIKEKLIFNYQFILRQKPLLEFSWIFMNCTIDTENVISVIICCQNLEIGPVTLLILQIKLTNKFCQFSFLFLFLHTLQKYLSFRPQEPSMWNETIKIKKSFPQYIKNYLWIIILVDVIAYKLLLLRILHIDCFYCHLIA